MSGAGAASGADHLEKLAAGLDSRAYVITLESGQGRRPHLSIANRQATQLTGFIYAAPDGSGEWWYWWGWADRIAAVADLAAAVAAVDRVLRVLGGSR